MSSVWASWGQLWQFDDPVHFDGNTKRILIQPQVTTITTQDIYSSWVRWASLYDHLKYQPAMRTVGGDELPGGQYSGVFLFLTNGWQIVINHLVTIDGILYSDTSGQSPYIINSGGGVVNKVASLAYAYNTSGVSVPTVNEIWSHNSRTLTSNPGASTDDIATAVWNKSVSSLGDKTTIGGYLTKALLSIPKFLGLK